MEKTNKRIFENIKTKKKYIFCGIAIDTTNKKDGTPMIIYRQDTDCDGPTFVRNRDEFHKKFIEVI